MSTFTHCLSHLSRGGLLGLSAIALAGAVSALGCDPMVTGPDEPAAQRTSPPFDPTPKDIAASPQDCGCAVLDAPVCGIDGGTYPSDCEANCADVPVDHDGPCAGDEPTPCGVGAACGGGEFCDFGATCEGVGGCATVPTACAREYDPVCGCDGETYENACSAHAQGVSVASTGACADECVCPLVYDPVCGVDGKTYGNACAAGCADIAVDHPGQCDATCESDADCTPGQFCERDDACDGPGTCLMRPDSCLDKDMPVCGCDGESYANPCLAHVAGTSVAAEGACEGLN